MKAKFTVLTLLLGALFSTQMNIAFACGCKDKKSPAPTETPAPAPSLK